jgi:ABC-2 type transport system ATP-binding protein
VDDEQDRPMMQSPAVETRGLNKFYGSVHALQGVDLEVARGEMFGFLGPNGSGKTTTIRCLLDLIRPSSGSIRVLGLDPQAEPIAVRARVGYLPGELRLDDNMTASELFRYFNRLRGGRAEPGYIRQLADRVDLDLETPVKNFSKGNKQKVGVVQALMHRPELLLLDEPTSGLDPLMQQEVLRLIGTARAEGATVFFSSHVLSEVQEVAERVAILRNGAVVEVAETAALMNRAMRRVRVRFRETVDTAVLDHLSGVKVLERDDRGGVVLQVSGEMDDLIKALAGFHVRDFETERASLEEVFLAYYEGGRPGEA